MNKDQKIILLILGLVMILTYMSYYAVMENNVAVSLVDGQRAYVNLDQWDEMEESVKLAGEWAYYDRQLHDEVKDEEPVYVQIPEYRKHEVNDDYYRYGTYYLDLVGLKPSHAYGVFSGSQVTAYNLYVNDQRVMSNGQVGKSPETHRSEWKHTSSNFVSDDQGRAQIAIEISNYDYQDGLFWNPLVIGEPNNIFKSHMVKVVANVILIILFSSLFLILIIVYLRFKIDKSMLYFILFLGDIIVRMMVTSTKPILYLVDEVPWSLLLRVEYMAGYLILPIFSVFLLELTRFNYNRLIKYMAAIYSVIVIVFVGTLSHSMYSSFFFPYLWISAISLVLIGHRVRLHYKENRFHKWIMIMVLVNILVAILNQLFGSIVSYVPIAMLNVIISLTLILVMRVVAHIRKNDLLAFSAMIDQLTGLYNRKYIQEIQTNQSLTSEGKSYYILFMDLDGFKKVNDLYDHDEGDQVLQIVSQRLRGCLREGDVLLRYGGDEFILIANFQDTDQVEELARRIIEKITRKIVHEGKVHTIGISIGINRCKSLDEANIESSIKSSDAAMYEAKNNGGNQYLIV